MSSMPSWTTVATFMPCLKFISFNFILLAMAVQCYISWLPNISIWFSIRLTQNGLQTNWENQIIQFTRIGWLGLLTISCSSSWSWSWSWTRPAGVPTEGLGRGAANKGGWSPQDPDPKSFHRTIWPFLWPNW